MLLKSTKKRPKKYSVKKVAAKVRNAYTQHKETGVHRSFRLSRRSEIPILEKLPSWWKLMRRTAIILWGQRSIISALLILYIIIAWSLSGMFALTDFADLKSVLLEDENAWSLGGIMALVDSFFTAQTTTIAQNQPALLMLNLFSLLFWLAFVWVARYKIAKKVTSVREALYTSGTSLIPFLMLLALIFLQCLPAAYGFSLTRTIAEGRVFAGGFEVAAFSLLAFLLVITSVYFVIGTITALQIVALPGMYPWKALQNARHLIMGRRFSVLRKYIMLVVILGLSWIALFAPTLLLENAICGPESCWVGITILPFIYYLLLGFMVLFASVYLYVTYRELLALQEKN